MTDHEFDEIDKAVASAMTPESPRQTTVPVRTVTPVVPERPQAPATQRTNGRAMDIMRPAAKAAPLVTPSLQPTEPATDTPEVSPVVASLSTSEAPAETPAEPSQPEEAVVEPVSTPFLPDAQDRIEKRPLNAEAAVESVAPTPLTDTAPAPDPAPVPDIPPSVVPQADATSPQSGAIFDTEQYHTPVVPPQKKTPVWGIVIWLVVLVLFGAAAGWAIFTFVLPLLG